MKKKTESNFYMRISTPPVHNYSRGVKIGNWFEDECKYEKQQHKHRSIYNLHFSKPKMYPIDFSEMYKPKFRAYGLEGHILLWNGEEYLKNFATTYDLTYRHLKKGLNGPILKKDRVNLVENFGNITKYDDTANTACKHWECDQYSRDFSEYINEYLPPTPEDYLKSPFRRSKVISENSFSVNNIQLRQIAKPVYVFPTSCSFDKKISSTTK